MKCWQKGHEVQGQTGATCLCVFVCPVVGVWVNWRGRRPCSNQFPECYIKAYSQGCVSSTVGLLYHEQWKVLMRNLIPEARGRKQLCRARELSSPPILWRCVFMCCIVCHIQSGASAVRAVNAGKDDPCFYLDWLFRKKGCLCLTICDTQLNLIKV